MLLEFQKMFKEYNNFEVSGQGSFLTVDYLPTSIVQPQVQLGTASLVRISEGLAEIKS